MGVRQAPSATIISAAQAHISDFVAMDAVYAAALDRAAVLIIGSWSFGLGDKHSDLDLLVLLRDREYDRLSPRLSTTARATIAHAPILTAAKIRSVSQVVEAYDPVILWFVLKNAHCLREYDGTFHEVRSRSEASFLTDLPNLRLRKLALLRREFDWLRYSAERTLGTSYQLMVADFVQYVWELLFLHDGEPYPYTKWIHSLIATLPSYSSFPPELVAMVESLLGMTAPTETRARAERVIEMLLGWLATTDVSYKRTFWTSVRKRITASSLENRMRGFNLDQLGTFVEVIERGSFSAAADRLDLTQPAVSLQVRQLEKRLGVRLIERVGRRARPTPAGSELLVHARHIAEAVAAAQQSLAPYASDAIGRVRIGSGATACIHFLPSVLRDLRQRFPKLEIIVSTGNAVDVLRQIEENLLDVGLVTLPASGRMFDVSPLLEDEFVVLSSTEGEPLPRAVTPQVLAQQPIVIYEPGAQTRHILDSWFAAAGLRIKPAMEIGSVEAMKELVLAGLGCGIVPRMAVDTPHRSPELRIQPLSPRLTRNLGVVMRRDKPLHRGLRETVAALRRASSTFSRKKRQALARG